MKMKIPFAFLLLSVVPLVGSGQVISEIDTSHIGELVLEQNIIVKAPLAEVWDAFATKEGWEGWAVAKSEVDWRIGGTIKSVYGEDAEVGDSSTITNHILQIVPHKLVTLQAELSPHFPEFMKEDASRLSNTLLFKEIGPNETLITSYGIGYRNNKKYRELMDFFIKGNEMSYQNLINYLEN